MFRIWLWKTWENLLRSKTVTAIHAWDKTIFSMRKGNFISYRWLKKRKTRMGTVSFKWYGKHRNIFWICKLCGCCMCLLFLNKNSPHIICIPKSNSTLIVQSSAHFLLFYFWYLEFNNCLFIFSLFGLHLFIYWNC